MYRQFRFSDGCWKIITTCETDSTRSVDGLVTGLPVRQDRQHGATLTSAFDATSHYCRPEVRKSQLSTVVFISIAADSCESRPTCPSGLELEHGVEQRRRPWFNAEGQTVPQRTSRQQTFPTLCNPEPSPPPCIRDPSNDSTITSTKWSGKSVRESCFGKVKCSPSSACLEALSIAPGARDI